MNEKCTLSNDEIVNAVQEWVSKLCDTGGRAWTLRVPVDFNRDPDMLITETCKRLQDAQRELAELREQRDGLETRCKRMSIAHAELEANCAALVEAVRWERECEDAAMYVQRVKYKRRGVGANALCSARIYWDDAIAAVDALVAE